MEWIVEGLTRTDCRRFTKMRKALPTSGNAFQQQSRKLAYFLAGLGAL